MYCKSFKLLHGLRVALLWTDPWFSQAGGPLAALATAQEKNLRALPHPSLIECSSGGKPTFDHVLRQLFPKSRKFGFQLLSEGLTSKRTARGTPFLPKQQQFQAVAAF